MKKLKRESKSKKKIIDELEKKIELLEKPTTLDVSE